MDKQDLLNKIYINIFDAITKYDIELCEKNYKLNRFKKTEIQANLTHEVRNKIKKLLHTYENEKYTKEKADKFAYREKWKDCNIPNFCKKMNLINEYIYLLERLNIINQELYNHTEFYENQYMIDYNHELFNIFKNKLGYYTKLINKIKEEMNNP